MAEERTVGKDDVRHGSEAGDKISRASDFVRAISWALNRNPNHRDHDRCENTDESCNR